MRQLLIAALSILLSATFAAAETAPIGWSDLIDAEALTYEDPYAALTYDQLDDLRMVVRLRQRLASGEVESDARKTIEARLAKSERTLAADGVDIDWLISQRWVVAERRERAATAGNPEVDGLEIIIAGFAVPAPPDEDGTSVAYLVPERGMCSHTPPPSANQMIRARLPEGWAPSWMHEPVRLTGRLSIAPTEQIVRVVDGMVPMRATFQLDVKQVETVRDMGVSSGQGRTSVWAEGIAKRFLGNGQPRSE